MSEMIRSVIKKRLFKSIELPMLPKASLVKFSCWTNGANHGIKILYIPKIYHMPESPITGQIALPQMRITKTRDNCYDAITE